MFLEYGVDMDGVLIHVDQVTSGRKEYLRCPYCGVSLIARKGDVKAYHFAHDGETCREVIERSDIELDLPMYDRFHLHLAAKVWDQLQRFARKEWCDYRLLEQHNLIRGKFSSSGYEFTHQGGIPFGETTLQSFAPVQARQFRDRFGKLEKVVRAALNGSPLKNYQPQLEHAQLALIDLNIYRAQFNRILQLDFYLLEIEHKAGTIYKAGITSRDIDSRIVEIERDLKPHLVGAKIKPLRILARQGAVEHYFKHRYKENQQQLGNLTEYFAFEDRRNILNDISRLGDRELDHFEQIIISGDPLDAQESVELEEHFQALRVAKIEHKKATKRGMEAAREKGVTLGRPEGSAEDEQSFLDKYPEVIAALNEGKSLRVTSKECAVSVNTVRKVKALLE